MLCSKYLAKRDYSGATSSRTPNASKLNGAAHALFKISHDEIIRGATWSRTPNASKSKN